MTTFAELHNELIKLDAFKEVAPGRKGIAVFFSGEGNADLVDECKKINPDTYSINDTPAGEFLKSEKVEDAYANGKITKAEFFKLGDTASQMFAAEAEGEGIVFARGARVTGTLARKEVPVFGLGNSGLTSLNGVNIDLVKQIGVDTPAKMQNTLQMLGDHSDLSNCFPPNGGAGAVVTSSHPVSVPDNGSHINYWKVAAGVALGVGAAAAFQPELEPVAASLIGAGLVGASVAKTKPEQGAYNDLEQNSQLAQAVAQLQKSGATLQQNVLPDYASVPQVYDLHSRSAAAQIG